MPILISFLGIILIVTSRTPLIVWTGIGFMVWALVDVSGQWVNSESISGLR